MNLRKRTTQIAEKPRDALEALRDRTDRFAAIAIPRAASAAETAGSAISDFALSSSKTIARSLRQQKGKSIGNSALAVKAAPLVRSVIGAAKRNPLLFATAGAAVAVLGYVAFHKREEEEPVPA